MKTPMIILMLLTTPLIIETSIAWFKHRSIQLEQALVWGVVAAFLFFALGHFVKAEGMIEMLPAWVPAKLAVVYFSGVWELFIAIGLLSTRYRSITTHAALITLVLFFPVNIYAAMNLSGLGGHQWGPIYLTIRGPLQILLVVWCAWILKLTRSTPRTSVF